jgi:hypothetical protein
VADLVVALPDKQLRLPVQLPEEMPVEVPQTMLPQDHLNIGNIW